MHINAVFQKCSQNWGEISRRIYFLLMILTGRSAKILHTSGAILGTMAKCNEVLKMWSKIGRIWGAFSPGGFLCKSSQVCHSYSCKNFFSAKPGVRLWKWRYSWKFSPMVSVEAAFPSSLGISLQNILQTAASHSVTCSKLIISSMNKVIVAAMGFCWLACVLSLSSRLFGSIPCCQLWADICWQNNCA